MRYGHAQTVGIQAIRLRNNLRKFWALSLVACSSSFLVLLSGCAAYVNAAKQTSSAASFQLSPSSVNFGQVTVGGQTTQAITVSNTGNAGMNITQLIFSDAHFSAVGTTLPMALAIGQSTGVKVMVSPTAVGSLSGTLTVQGDGGSTPVVVKLSATAVSAQSALSINPTAISFGSVAVGSKGTSSLILSNGGSADVTVSLLTLAGSDFTISGVTTPATIGPGQSALLSLAFAPTAAGSATGNLTITNSGSSPTISVPLSGTGTSTATGQLNANVPSLNFGPVATGSAAEKQIVLTNGGNGSVQISGISVVGAGITTNGITAPTTLNASQTATLTASFAPSAVGSVSGSITIVSNAGNSPLTIPVTGTGAQAGIIITPASYSFGSVVDGQTKSQTITLGNTGSIPLTIAELTVNGAAYSVSGLTTPTTVAAGGSTTFSVVFAPTTAGSLGGSVSIASNAPNSPNVLALSGSGEAASITLSANPTSLTFGSVNAGSSSSKMVTITNGGNTDLTISQISISAKDVHVSGMTTPVTLTAGQSGAMSVSFAPTASENVAGNITIASSQGASAVIPVTGSGVQPALTITPSSASFGSVTEGSPATQTIQLSNSGTGTLTITQVSVAGSGFSTGTLTLPITLSSGQATNFNVQFAPTSAGAASGNVTIVSNAPNSPSVIGLSGTGVAATELLTFSTTNIGFGSVNDGSSATQNVNVTNSGNAKVTVSQISESGTGFSLSGASAPVTLTAGQALTFGVVFSPSAAGSETGTVTVASTASGSPVSIALSGTGVQVNHSVNLAWVASATTVSGYNVYRSTTSGSGYTKINAALVPSLTYDDTTVQGGTTYYYVVTAVDSSGDESADSNQATAVIP
ncbi:MAG: choice-of-anchor D domain-containing protein [Candidatus Acidiferrum sp.]